MDFFSFDIKSLVVSLLFYVNSFRIFGIWYIVFTSHMHCSMCHILTVFIYEHYDCELLLRMYSFLHGILNLFFWEISANTYYNLFGQVTYLNLILSSYRNQSINLMGKSIDWLLFKPVFYFETPWKHQKLSGGNGLNFIRSTAFMTFFPLPQKIFLCIFIWIFNLIRKSLWNSTQ